MSIPTRNYIYGLSPLKRENPARGQSEWYYFDPRNASTFSDFKQIDVPSQNTPNPYAKEIQNYIFKTDSDNYKLLYGNAQPPQENQQNQPQQENVIGMAKNVNNNFFQPQSTLGQAISNNVAQQPAPKEQSIAEAINSSMPKSVDDVPDMNYIMKIRKLLGDDIRNTQDAFKTKSNLDNAKTFILDDFGRLLSGNYLQELAEKRKNDEIKHYKIGSLSRQYEAENNPAAVGYDSAGGASYGLYQIATKPGTMNEYLQFLGNSNNLKYKNYAVLLNKAGGNEGASNRTAEFIKTWKKLADEDYFSSSQSEFIGKNRYERILERIQDIKGLNLEKRHPVVSDVIRSMAVQHGSANIPIHNALGTNSDISSWSDKDIINSLYDARTEYVKGLQNMDLSIKQNILNNRYPSERAKALKELDIKYY